MQNAAGYREIKRDALLRSPARGGLDALHSAPVNKGVHIVYEKHGKAYEHGYIRHILRDGESPEHYEHDIVGGIGKREETAAAEREIDGYKAGCNGNCARDDVCRVEGL